MTHARLDGRLIGLVPQAPAGLTPEDPDQELRLLRFQKEHPEVNVGGGDGFRQACIPEENGETVITRYSLRELLDELEHVVGGGQDQPSTSG